MATGAVVNDMIEKNFNHPFKPYPIQQDFMQKLYGCIEDGSIGIFESPTGTGKSLSLICGSLTWLREQQLKAFESNAELSEDDETEDEPKWIREHEREQRAQDATRRRQERTARLAKIREREAAQRSQYLSRYPEEKRRKVDDSGTSEKCEDIEAQFLVDAEVGLQASVPEGPTSFEGLSAKTLELIERIKPANKAKDADELEEDELKIFYCSRTHSQLSQFANELRKVKLPRSFQGKQENERQSFEDLRHLTLGSRKNLCINSAVSRLGSATMINERCLELQEPGTSADRRCPHRPNRDNEALVIEFRDQTMARIRDIEDMGELGKKISVCPYYASRAAIKPSEIVTLPYPLLLQKSSREALGLSIKGHVVIIDEAHNLMDAIASINASSVSLVQLKASRDQLEVYLLKFKNRLKGQNRVFIVQTVRVINSLISFLQSKVTGAKTKSDVVAAADLLSGKGADQVNIHDLVRYLQNSKLPRKVSGYAIFSESQNGPRAAKYARPQRQNESIETPALMHVQNFLQSLAHPSAEGRIFYETDGDGICGLRYMLLDPSHHFRDVVEDARAVILAGGTMSPMKDYVDHLFGYVKPDTIRQYSFGHVVPKSNLVALQVSNGPSGLPFEFTFERRDSPSMTDELADALIQLCKRTPDGIIVFFPSYAFLAKVIQSWQQKSESPAMSKWDVLSQTKQMFQESRDNPNIDVILDDYAEAIEARKGGLLLSVINGKMSEGINFADRLGRMVVVCGLPFPNMHSAEWRAKLQYVEDKASSKDSASAGKAAAREFYENNCMRAVNQSIGRVIRHQNDYAAVVLLDKRFSNGRISNKLPGWIRSSLQRSNMPFGAVADQVTTFFQNKSKAAS